MATEQTAGIDFRQYLAVLRRHILVIIVLTVALGVAGYAYASSKTPMYEASAVLLYEPQLDITDPLAVLAPATRSTRSCSCRAR